MLSFSLASLALLASVQLTAAATINVTVGGTGILKFDPESVTANPGDTIHFIFKQKNHTVTQSTLASPCASLGGGFDSGFQPVADGATNFPAAEMQIKDTTPIWAYCRQGTHCQSGMVFAVNPGNQFAAFKAAATGAGGATTSSSAVLASPSPSAASPPPATTPTVSTSTDHRIVVGGTGVLAFNPSNITAKVGDTITFEFHEKNHTVTQSTFTAPCVSAAGFDSGFFPVAAGATTFPNYVVQVNDTKPIWAYCKQVNHCTQGMVFSANADESSSKSFSAFQANAKQSSNGQTTTGGSTPGYGSGAGVIWRPSIGSTSMAVLFVVSIAALAL